MKHSIRFALLPHTYKNAQSLHPCLGPTARFCLPVCRSRVEATAGTPPVAPRQARRGGGADGDRNAELSNANKSFADHRVTGDPPCSSPRRRATSTRILESTNNHKPYFIKHRTGFCLLGFISGLSVPCGGHGRHAEAAGMRRESC
jgi:hypothetical protein